MTAYRYYKVEDRLYRAPDDKLWAMEKLAVGQWLPYAGDAAKVLFDGVRIAPPPDEIKQ